MSSQSGEKRPRVSRRRFVRGVAMGAGALALVPILEACGDSATPNPAAGSVATTAAPATTAAFVVTTAAPAAPVTTQVSSPTTAIAAPTVISKSNVTLTVMTKANEMTAEEMKPFLEANPNIKLERIDDDSTRFKAMLAAGNPPDLFRTFGPAVPSLVNRGIVYDLSSYFNSSALIKADDLAPVNNLYTINGKRYGMAKDWSPDYSLYVSNAAFEEAGLPLPSTTQPLLYSEIKDLAGKLTKRQGDRTLRIGFATETGFLPRTIQVILGEQDQKLYKADGSAIVMKDNPNAMTALRYFYDMAKANLTWNPLNPDPSWLGDDFNKGQIAILQYGYWFSGYMLGEKDVAVKDKVTLLPAPTWTGKKRLNPTVTGTGLVVSKATKNPDAAWKLFEYYMAGGPAQARAKSGYGVPSLKSLYASLPKENAFQKQALAVLHDDLKYSDFTVEFNPYYDDSVFDKSWTANLEQSLRGTITFEQMIGNIESDVNKAIAEGRAKSS